MTKLKSMIDYIREPSDVRAKRKALEKAIEEKHIYKLKEDAEAYIWHGTYKDKPLQVLYGERCYLTDTPTDSGYAGVQMIDENKYPRKLSINISHLIEA